MQTYKIYVGGHFLETDKVLEVENPHTQKVFAKTFQGGEKEFELATKAAQAVEAGK